MRACEMRTKVQQETIRNCGMLPVAAGHSSVFSRITIQLVGGWRGLRGEGEGIVGGAK